MRRFGWCVFVALVALGPARGGDPPKDDTKDQTPKEKFQALVKEVQKQQSEVLAEARKAKGEEQQKLFEKYQGISKEFAEKFFQLAEDNPKDPAAADALFWIVQNAQGSPAFAKASEKVLVLVGEMPAKDLMTKLNMMRSPTPNIVAAVVKKVESDDKPEAADLLAWAATTGGFTPAGQKASTILVEKFPDHRSIEQICTMLSRRYTAKNVETLQQIYDKSTKDNVKAAAALGLGKCIVSRVDGLGDNLAEADKVAAEAEKYLTKVIEEFGEKNASKKKEAEQELKALQTLRVGKVAPDIIAPDLDGKEFKLSEYRGKVVMLDFWGHW